MSELQKQVGKIEKHAEDCFYALKDMFETIRLNYERGHIVGRSFEITVLLGAMIDKWKADLAKLEASK